MNVFIYCLFDENEIPFYIGKTKNPLKKRESQHQKRLQKDLTIFKLDTIKEDEWKFWECYWIEQFKCWGLDLDNKNNDEEHESTYNDEYWENMLHSKSFYVYSYTNNDIENNNKRDC